jgi:hypothetical protein
MMWNARLAPFLLPALALGALGCIDDTAAVAERPAQFISARRAWRPGERDSLIQAVVANRSFLFPYVGDLSDYAPRIFADTDSVTVIVPNPLYVTERRAGALGPTGSFDLFGARFAADWNIFGMDIREIDQTQSPTDTIIDWLATFWSNPAEDTWKGLVVAFRCGRVGGAALADCRASRSSTTPFGGNVGINTAEFNADEGKKGAGGGEFRQDSLQYWEANDGAFRVTAASYGADSEVTSGPFTGGSIADGTMQGRMDSVVMPQLLPSAGPAIVVDFDFRFVPISAVRLTCVFRQPGPQCYQTAAAARSTGSAARSTGSAERR